MKLNAALCLYASSAHANNVFHGASRPLEKMLFLRLLIQRRYSFLSCDLLVILYCVIRDLNSSMAVECWKMHATASVQWGTNNVYRSRSQTLQARPYEGRSFMLNYNDKNSG